MKNFLVVVVVLMIAFNSIKSEVFTPEEITKCEGVNTDGTDLSSYKASDCNFGYDSEKSKKTGYSCCLVKYKFNKKTVKKCYLIKNTDSAISDYKKHALGYLDNVKVECKNSSAFMRVGLFFLVFLFFF